MYFDPEMEEAVEMMSMYDNEDDFMSRYDDEPRWDDDEDEPFTEKPKGKFRMNNPAVLPIPKTKPDTKPVEPSEPDEWEEGPDTDEPSIEPGTNPNPLGRSKPNIRSFKRDFDRKMQRMDESFYKPIKYKKY